MSKFSGTLPLRTQKAFKGHLADSTEQFAGADR